MNGLYRVTQVSHRGWDTYSAAVVCAASPQDARACHPAHGWDTNAEEDAEGWMDEASRCWPTDRACVAVTRIGSADACTPQGVVMASFRAG